MPPPDGDRAAARAPGLTPSIFLSPLASPPAPRQPRIQPLWHRIRTLQGSPHLDPAAPGLADWMLPVRPVPNACSRPRLLCPFPFPPGARPQLTVVDRRRRRRFYVFSLASQLTQLDLKHCVDYAATSQGSPTSTPPGSHRPASTPVCSAHPVQFQCIPASAVHPLRPCIGRAPASTTGVAVDIASFGRHRSCCRNACGSAVQACSSAPVAVRCSFDFFWRKVKCSSMMPVFRFRLIIFLTCSVKSLMLDYVFVKKVHSEQLNSSLHFTKRTSIASG